MEICNEVVKSNTAASPILQSFWLEKQYYSTRKKKKKKKVQSNFLKMSQNAKLSIFSFK